MKEKGIFEVKAKLSQICAEVAESGEPVTVSRRGVPLVRIVPIRKGGRQSASVWDTVEESKGKYGPLDEEIDLEPRSVDETWKESVFDDE